ncbi:MAG: hypothetical protein COB84_09585 [Rhodobacteraceae bacterium]|nr:MAG: hypothetical protein COB84_09585 [Paracoccaceae bacterium]
MPLQFTTIRINGDPFNGGPLSAGVEETAIVVDDDDFFEPGTTDTGVQLTIEGVDIESAAWPDYVGSGVEMYTATAGGSTVTFAYLTSSGDGEDDGFDRIVVLSGSISPGDTISGITPTTSNTNLEYSTIPGVVCFTPGVMISTPKGAIAIEHLRVGDLVITADNGLQAVRWIGQKQMSGARLAAHPHLQPVLIKAHAFGQNAPERDMHVSPQHRMFLNSAKSQMIFGEREVLVPAKALVNDTSIMVDRASMAVTYIHVMFDKHELINANGSWSESFHPGAVGLNALEQSARAELLEIFPNLARNPNRYGASARKALSVQEARLLTSSNV